MISKAIFGPSTTRWLQTLNLFIGVLAVGLCIAVYGVSLLDMSEIYNVEVDSVVYTLSTRSAGSIIVALAGGFIFGKINGQIVVFVSTLTAGISLALIPLCPSFFWTHVMCFILGACIGLIEIGANVWLIVLWKERGPSILQFYHFMFGVGAVIAPFFTEPYFSRKIVSANSTLSAVASNVTEAAVTEFIPSRIHLPFAYFGGVYLLSAFLMLLMFLVNSDNFCDEDDSSGKRPSLSKRVELFLMFMVCTYVVIGVAMEQTFSSMCTVYAVEYLGFSKTSASYLAGVFWGSFTLSRVVATLLSMKFQPMALIIVNHVFLMLSAIVMTSFPSTEIVVWSMTVVYAFTLSPFFGNVCGLALNYIFINHNYFSAIIISVCLGAMLPPVTIGPFIQKYPMSFIYANLFLTVSMTLVALGLMILGRHINATKPLKENEYDPVELGANES